MSVKLYIPDLESGEFLGMTEAPDDWPDAEKFVHYPDHEKLITALRLIRRNPGSKFVEEIAEAALLSAGEEL